MDYSEDWKQFLAENPEIEGGALMTADGSFISSAAIEDAERASIAHCAALVAIAHQLIQDAMRGEFDVLVVEGKQGYVVLMPILDKAILAVLARKQAKLGLVILDMRCAIDTRFGSGLASEAIISPQPPMPDDARAKPDWGQWR